VSPRPSNPTRRDQVRARMSDGRDAPWARQLEAGTTSRENGVRAAPSITSGPGARPLAEQKFSRTEGVSLRSDARVRGNSIGVCCSARGQAPGPLLTVASADLGSVAMRVSSSVGAADRTALVWVACVACVIASSCTFKDATFGAPCTTNTDCADGYRCFTEACVPNDFPDEQVNPDEGEGEGGEGEEGEGEGGPQGDTCDDAIPIALGVDVPGSTALAADDSETTCAGEDAPDRVYVLTLATETNLIVTVEPAGFDVALYAATGCGILDVIDNSCTDDPTDPFADETLNLLRVGPGDIYITVDGARPAINPVAGSYTLRVDEELECGAQTEPFAGTCAGVVGSAQMSTTRTQAQATRLTDGRVLVTGGRSTNSVQTTNSVELYLPDTKEFEDTTAMLDDRARHQAVLLNDGRVLVAGGTTGVNGTYTPIPNVEIFDPVDASWTPGPPLPSAREFFTATLLGDGRVLVVGGRNGGTTHDDAFVLDAAQGAWTPVTDGISFARFGHTATRLSNGDVLIVGGRLGADNITLDETERFVVGTNSFIEAASPSEDRGGHTATLMDDGRVVVVGGFSHDSADDDFVALDDTDIYDPGADSWSIAANITQPRSFAVAGNLPGVGVLFVGGDVDGPLATADVYVPADDRWEPLPPLLAPRLAATGAVLDDVTILVVGGDGNAQFEQPLDSVEIYGLADP